MSGKTGSLANRAINLLALVVLATLAYLLCGLVAMDVAEGARQVNTDHVLAYAVAASLVALGMAGLAGGRMEKASRVTALLFAVALGLWWAIDRLSF